MPSEVTSPRSQRRFRLSLRATLGLVAVVALLCWGYAEWFSPVRRFRREIRDEFGLRRWDAVSRVNQKGAAVDRATAFAELIGALDDPDPAVRRSAVELIGWLGGTGPVPRAAVSALVKRLDPASPLREPAAKALGFLKPDNPAKAEAIPPLLRLLNDPKDGVRFAAACTLARLGAGERAVPVLRDYG